MEYEKAIPFKLRGSDQEFQAILLSSASSLLTICAANPFGKTPAYFSGIPLVKFVASVVRGEYVATGKDPGDFQDAELLRLLALSQSSPQEVWSLFVACYDGDKNVEAV